MDPISSCSLIVRLLKRNILSSVKVVCMVFLVLQLRYYFTLVHEENQLPRQDQENAPMQILSKQLSSPEPQTLPHNRPYANQDAMLDTSPVAQMHPAISQTKQVSEPELLFGTWMDRLQQFVDKRGKMDHKLLSQPEADTMLQMKKLTSIRPLETDFNIQESAKTMLHTKEVPIIRECSLSRKWAVMTSTAQKVTKTMRSIMNDPSWCMVVIGGNKEGPQFSQWLKYRTRRARFVYLSKLDQRQLPFNIVPLTPVDHHSRKNIGYLFAMSQGAEVILDLEDGTEPIIPVGKNHGHMWPVETDFGAFQRPVLYGEDLYMINRTDVADIPVWNPYPFFGHTKAWPRGYPWEYIMFDNQSQPLDTKNHLCKPIVQQYLTNWDPDLEAAYKMMSSSSHQDYEWRGKLRKIVLPRNIFSPYNSQATIHLSQAFWSMMLPISLDAKVADIWRSYIAQSLFHVIPDACVMFISPIVLRRTKQYNYSTDFLREIPLYSSAAGVIQLLRNTPAIGDTFPPIFLGVYKKLYETGVVELEDYKYAAAWMKDIQDLKAHVPSIPGNRTWLRNTTLCMSFTNTDIRGKSHLAKELLAKYLPLFQDAIVFMDQMTTTKSQQLDKDTSAENAPLLEPFSIFDNENSTQGLRMLLEESTKRDFRSNSMLKCLENAGDKNVLYMKSEDFLNFAFAHESLPKQKIWTSVGPPHLQPELYNDLMNKNATRETGSHQDHHRADILKNMWHHLKQQINDPRQTSVTPFYIPQKYHRQIIELTRFLNELQLGNDPDVSFLLALKMVAEGEGSASLIPAVQLGKDEDGFRLNHVKNALIKVFHTHPVDISCPAMRALWRDAMATQYTWLQ